MPAFMLPLLKLPMLWARSPLMRDLIECSHIRDSWRSASRISLRSQAVRAADLRFAAQNRQLKYRETNLRAHLLQCSILFGTYPFAIEERACTRRAARRW